LVRRIKINGENMETNILPNSSLLDIPSFSRILNKKYLTNSYKIYWLYGLLEER